MITYVDARDVLEVVEVGDIESSLRIHKSLNTLYVPVEVSIIVVRNGGMLVRNNSVSVLEEDMNEVIMSSKSVRFINTIGTDKIMSPKFKSYLKPDSDLIKWVIANIENINKCVPWNVTYGKNNTVYIKVDNDHGGNSMCGLTVVGSAVLVQKDEGHIHSYYERKDFIYMLVRNLNSNRHIEEILDLKYPSHRHRIGKKWSSIIIEGEIFIQANGSKRIIKRMSLEKLHAKFGTPNKEEPLVGHNIGTKVAESLLRSRRKLIRKNMGANLPEYTIKDGKIVPRESIDSQPATDNVAYIPSNDDVEDSIVLSKEYAETLVDTEVGVIIDNAKDMEETSTKQKSDITVIRYVAALFKGNYYVTDINTGKHIESGDGLPLGVKKEYLELISELNDRYPNIIIIMPSENYVQVLQLVEDSKYILNKENLVDVKIDRIMQHKLINKFKEIVDVDPNVPIYRDLRFETTRAECLVRVYIDDLMKVASDFSGDTFSVVRLDESSTTHKYIAAIFEGQYCVVNINTGDYIENVEKISLTVDTSYLTIINTLVDKYRDIYIIVPGNEYDQLMQLIDENEITADREKLLSVSIDASMQRKLIDKFKENVEVDPDISVLHDPRFETSRAKCLIQVQLDELAKLESESNAAPKYVAAIYNGSCYMEEVEYARQVFSIQKLPRVAGPDHLEIVKTVLKDYPEAIIIMGPQDYNRLIKLDKKLKDNDKIIKIPLNAGMQSKLHHMFRSSLEDPKDSRHDHLFNGRRAECLAKVYIDEHIAKKD